MPISLTEAQIIQALPKVEVGLRKYAWLQDNLKSHVRLLQVPSSEGDSITSIKSVVALNGKTNSMA